MSKIKVFSWDEMWSFINMLIDNKDRDIDNLFTERGADGKLINAPKAKEFLEKIKNK